MEKHRTTEVAIVMSKEQKINNEIVAYHMDKRQEQIWWKNKNTDYCFHNAVLMFAFKRLKILAKP